MPWQSPRSRAWCRTRVAGHATCDARSRRSQRRDPIVRLLAISSSLAPADKQYNFQIEDGTKTLRDLYDDRSQLLVYHFIFGTGFRVDDQTEGCTGCSFVADHLDGAFAAPQRPRRDAGLRLMRAAGTPAGLQDPDALAVPVGLVAPQRLQLRLRSSVHRTAAARRRRLQLPARRQTGAAARGTERLRHRRRGGPPHLLHFADSVLLEPRQRWSVHPAERPHDSAVRDGAHAGHGVSVARQSLLGRH
jgi:Bacterial protein of unknown function (DUF899)